MQGIIVLALRSRNTFYTTQKFRIIARFYMWKRIEYLLEYLLKQSEIVRSKLAFIISQIWSILKKVRKNDTIYKTLLTRNTKWWNALIILLAIQGWDEKGAS